MLLHFLQRHIRIICETSAIESWAQFNNCYLYNRIIYEYMYMCSEASKALLGRISNALMPDLMLACVVKRFRMTKSRSWNYYHTVYITHVISIYSDNFLTGCYLFCGHNFWDLQFKNFQMMYNMSTFSKILIGLLLADNFGLFSHVATPYLSSTLCWIKKKRKWTTKHQIWNMKQIRAEIYKENSTSMS